VRLIAISGRAGSGKNTVAQILGGVELSFAEPLKRFAQDVFAFTNEQVWGPSEARNRPDTRYPRTHGPISTRGVCGCCGWSCVVGGRIVCKGDPDEPQCYLTPRYALQTLGTEWGRSCYENVWADFTVRRAIELVNPLVVITDCRFVNEARAVRVAGGEVWRVVRPGAGLQGSAGLHPSEAEQESPEFSELVTRVVMNSGSLAALRATVTGLCKST
jgi:hypothetical protein